tara:strand:+ start:317 stop:916 length:600 start_codon:yes stop_codon:yes gene_type:complete
MKIIVKDNINKAIKKINNFEKRHLPQTTAKAINITLFGLRKEMMKQLPRKLDRPTKTTLNGLFVFAAKRNHLAGLLFVKDHIAKYLRFVVEGGIRQTENKTTAAPSRNAPERVNAYGNIKGRRSGLIKNKDMFFGKIKYNPAVFQRLPDNKVKVIFNLIPAPKYMKNMFPFYKIGFGYIRSKFQKNFKRAFNEAKRGIR